ncbi:uncharacterized protein [Watersipora subatra]|uniref:uncharacterized protein n=1 Tax=Watersipora subatra TaxID=2589382 RepID=UPI00355BB3F9
MHIKHMICVLMVCAAVHASWIPESSDAASQEDLPVSDARPTRRSSSRRSHRYDGRRSPRLFDEFLQMIAISGEVPEMNADGSFSASRGTTPTRNSTDDVRDSMRSYIKGHRPTARESEEELEAEVLADEVEPSLETPRTRQTRDVDFGTIQDELEGIPRSHWSCCLLGQLAGDKGFLCDASFYATRVLFRNANRVHNRRLTGTYFRDGQATEAGQEMLNSFNSCVQTDRKAEEFEGCCRRMANIFEEREERWDQLYRRLRTNQ